MFFFLDIYYIDMGENIMRRYYNNVIAVIREISVEPAYLGMALSWGLYGIVSSELYISKVRKRSDGTVSCCNAVSEKIAPQGLTHYKYENFTSRYARSTWPSGMRYAIIFRDLEALSIKTYSSKMTAKDTNSHALLAC